MKSGSKVAVVSFWWGDWPENNPSLGCEYARRLRNAVVDNTTAPFDFLLFVDRDKYFGKDLEHIHKVILPSGFSEMRWNLKKIGMFSSRAGLLDYEWVVALDLDIFIKGNLDFLLNHRSSSLMTCMAAYCKDIGGSIIGFDPNQPWCETLAWWLIHNQAELEKTTKGSERKFYRLAVDKGILPRVNYWQASYPNQILSYKVDGIKPEASVVRFHGSPRPHETEVWGYVG